MDVILIVYILSIVLYLRFAKRGTEQEEYLSLDRTSCLRGFMAIGIVLHHMSERTNGGMLFPLLQHLGYLLVSVFFFLSGYGLMTSFNKRGSDYLQGFWKNRILYMSIVYLWISIIYAVFRYAMGSEMNVKSFVLSFVNGAPVASNSWYMIVQILLYIIFWGVFNYVRRSNKVKILIVFVIEIVLALIFNLLSYSAIWYISNFAFAVGLVWAEEKEEIDSIINKHWFLVEAILFIAFILFSGIPLVIDTLFFGSISIRLLCRFISSTAFVLVLIVAMKRIKIVGEMWKWIGKISLEIYLMHGLVILALKEVVSSDVVWTILVLVLSIVLAVVANFINSHINYRIKKIKIRNRFGEIK